MYFKDSHSKKATTEDNREKWQKEHHLFKSHDTNGEHTIQFETVQGESKVHPSYWVVDCFGKIPCRPMPRAILTILHWTYCVNPCPSSIYYRGPLQLKIIPYVNLLVLLYRDCRLLSVTKALCEGRADSIIHHRVSLILKLEALVWS